MSEMERTRWDERYASGDYRPRAEPSAFVAEAVEVVPPGRALVLACGTGRNAIFLAERGFRVEALDISSVAIEVARAEAARRAVVADFRVADLDSTEFQPGGYALVTMIRYVNRDLWDRAAMALAPAGWLLMEQHLRTYRDVAGPHDDEFRVAPGELLGAFPGLRAIHYSERLETAPEGDRSWALARYLGCKGDPGW